MQALVRTVRGSFARRPSSSIHACSFARLTKRVAAALLVAALLTPTFAHASPRPLDPGTVHVKVLKRGIGNFIAVQLADGIQLWGRILAVGDHSFTLQLHNDPQPTEVFYSDVAYTGTSFSTGQKIFMIGSIAGVAGFATWGFIHIHNLQSKPLAPPTPPNMPFP